MLKGYKLAKANLKTNTKLQPQEARHLLLAKPNRD